MKAYKQMRGRYEIIYYSVEITEDMKALALDFAKNIILTDNQYSRLLPENVKNSHDVSLQQKIEIQRTYMGKLGELAFAKFLDEKGKQVDIRGMFQIYEGQTNVDNFDFRTRNGMSVDIKTGFRNIHRRLLVNVEQFENLPKDYYVAVKLNAKDVNSGSLTLIENLFPSFSTAPGQEPASSAFVFPIPLPPEVAKGITVFPFRSYCSRNVLIMVGATYHQIGNPT